MRQQKQKFKELLIYIARKSEDDPRFGAVKLNKILYYSDFEAYRRLGRPITSMIYRHLDEGPVIRDMLPIRKELVDDGSITVDRVLYFGYGQERIVARREANLRTFSAEEITIVDQVVEWLKPLNGAQVSELSHGEFGWKITDDGEKIPYRTAWFSLQPLSQEQIENARKIGAAHGLAQNDNVWETQREVRRRLEKELSLRGGKSIGDIAKEINSKGHFRS